MATQEEVRIKLGVDGSSVGTGMAGVKNVVESKMKEITRSLGNIVKLNFLSMTGDLTQMWDKATQAVARFWHDLDGQMQRGAGLEAMRKSLKATVGEAQDAAQALNDVIAGRTFGAASPEKQFEMLNDQLNIAQQKADAAIAKFKELKAVRDSYRGKELPQTPAQSLAAGKAEAEMMRSQTGVLKIKTQLEAVANAIDVERNSNLQKRVGLVKEIIAAEAKKNAAEKGLGGAIRSMSDVSMSEAQRITDAAWGAQRLPELRMSRKQMNDVRQAALLERQAQQARIDNNPELADNLTQQRNDITKNMSFLSGMEADPLRIARDNLAASLAVLERLNKGIGVNIMMVKK